MLNTQKHKFFDSCRAKIGFLMAVMLLLSTICFISNILTIMTIYRNQTFRHSQHVYRVFIAFNDILLPVFVTPYMIHTFVTQSFYKLRYEKTKIFTSTQTTNSSDEIFFYTPSFDYLHLFTDSYLNFFGFISTIVLYCPSFTLLLASFDRFYAVAFPLKYRKNSSAKCTVKICICVWSMIALLAFLPILTESLYYKVRSRALITIHGKNSIVIKSILFGLPIPLIWIVSLLTFVLVRRKSRKTFSVRNNDRKREIKLAATLLLMVLTFTISVLPFTILYLLLLSMKPYEKITDVDFEELEALLNYEWVAFMLFLFNSMWNFFIYNIKDVKFRKEFYKSFIVVVRTVKCKFCFYDEAETLSPERSNVTNHTKNLKSI